MKKNITIGVLSFLLIIITVISYVQNTRINEAKTISKEHEIQAMENVHMAKKLEARALESEKQAIAQGDMALKHRAIAELAIANAEQQRDMALKAEKRAVDEERKLAAKNKIE